MHIGILLEPRGSFPLRFINIWHHICFLWSIDAHDVRTCPQRRYEAKSEDVTWRDVTSKSSIETRSRSNFMNIKWHLNNAKDVVTSKVDKVDIKRQPKCCLIYIFVYLKQKEKEWLIDYLYSILWYFILINFDKIL